MKNYNETDLRKDWQEYNQKAHEEDKMSFVDWLGEMDINIEDLQDEDEDEFEDEDFDFLD